MKHQNLDGEEVYDLQVILHELVDLHDGGFVAATVTVVGGGEDSDNVTLVSPVVPIHDQLMCTGNARQVVRVVELLRDVLTEAVASTARGNAPTASVIGVGPEEITDWALVGCLLNAIKLADLVQCVDAG